MSLCKICNEEINDDIFEEDFEELMARADAFGLQSLTENEQVVLEGKICSSKCYEEFEDRNS